MPKPIYRRGMKVHFSFACYYLLLEHGLVWHDCIALSFPINKFHKKNILRN